MAILFTSWAIVQNRIKYVIVIYLKNESTDKSPFVTLKIIANEFI